MAETLRRDTGCAILRHTSYLRSREDTGLLRTWQQVVELTPAMTSLARRPEKGRHDDERDEREDDQVRNRVQDPNCRGYDD
jgi:hypothetical protein